MHYTNGDHYKGSFVSGQRSGKGFMKYSQLETLHDPESRDERESQAEQPDDSGTYEGEWLHNRRHGQGTQRWSDGSSFTGLWKNDKRLKGVMTM